jgi:hypothetical protein
VAEAGAAVSASWAHIATSTGRMEKQKSILYCKLDEKQDPMWEAESICISSQVRNSRAPSSSGRV